MFILSLFLLKNEKKNCIIRNEVIMGKYYKIITYGCQMNVHESEKLGGILTSFGYEQTEDENIADVIVFNTCCIRENAENTARGNIGALKQLKKRRKDLIIAVGGCMTQQNGTGEDLIKKFPYINFVFGTHNLNSFGEMLQKAFDHKKGRIYRTETPQTSECNLMKRDSKVSAWVNIIYGCNNFCSYCIVPYVRGRERSRTIDEILVEVKDLIKNGYKEITLLGQNVNSYGNDLNDGSNFAQLLQQIDKIEGDFRVRFMTSHPKDMTEEVIDVIASSNKICHSIHLPLQSGSNRVLKAMNRKYTVERYLQIVDYIKEKLPDCGITTDIMVGFPGETEEDFVSTMQVVEKVRYSGAFTFVYSPRKGTPASTMEQVDKDVAKSRIVTLVDRQNAIIKEDSAKLVGQVYKVLCEDLYPKREGYCCGRTDNGRLVNFSCSSDKIGKFINVRIQSVKSSALIGVLEE